MRRLALLIALAPGIAFAAKPSPCAFTLGHGSIKAQSSDQPDKLVPYWFTNSGRAEVEIIGRKLTAKLFDSSASGDQTHAFTAKLSTLSTKGTPFKTAVSAKLKNLSSDAGDDALSGVLEVTIDPHAQGKPILHSLVVHNAYSFVALNCYGKSPT